MSGPTSIQPRPVVAVGTGRCGTRFLATLFGSEGGVHACHESDPMNEAFHRYCRWNRLPVDDGGFLAIKRGEIALAQSRDKVFFEASAYLSLSILELHEAFRPRFILITRNPVDTVNSLWAKGWYEIAYRKQQARAPVGYHAVGAPHHFFSRLVPLGEEFRPWQALTRIGKLGWYWGMLHREIMAQLERIPQADWTVVALERLDHAGYLRLAEFAGIRPRLTAAGFREIAAHRPGALPMQRRLRDWDGTEAAEFGRQVAAAARRLGYDEDLAARLREAGFGGLPRDCGA